MQKPYSDSRVVDPAAFEQLGAFYLGRLHDPASGQSQAAPLLYDAKDLTTHAVCVGMTGSGKTGLCLSLLEEAAIDGIPTIAIDPKGDLGNLLLTFPALEAGDFEPWVEPEAAARKGESLAEHAAAVARLWRKGLGDWGQDGRRIARLREAAEVSIYTPGSSAGRPVSVLRSFAAPAVPPSEDAEAFRDRVSAAVSGLLSLIGVEADPVRSREHILLSSILTHHWSAGRDLDVGQLIREVQAPPFDKIGVLDLEAVYPAKDRFELSMMLNGLIASPAFAAWMEGEPIDVGRLLWDADGKPRVAIFSIAHLSDAERMFFVTLLLTEILAWVRAQSGSTSLRALLYMDEVFGYLPPTANPPSKLPLLTLLKQARAFGLGVVLATQNPVDLDYKGLSNTGTWFIGRLQTERDKLRVLDGLEGASAAAGAAVDRAALDRMLSGLSSRVFMMNNVHEDAPVLFQTRWALSYLRGPLTRDQIRVLTAKAPTDDAPPTKRAADAVPAAPSADATAVGPATLPAAARPLLPPGIAEFFLALETAPSDGSSIVYRPFLQATTDLHYVDTRRAVDHWRSALVLAPLNNAPPANPWREAELAGPETLALDDEPLAAAGFDELPAAASQPKRYDSWRKALAGHLYRAEPLALLHCESLELVSEAGEDEAAFRIRLREAAHQRRDLEIEKLRQRYALRLKRLDERLRSATERLEREQSEFSDQAMRTAVSFGSTVLGALFGRKLGGVGTVGRGSSALRSASRAARQRQDVARAQERIAEVEQEAAALSAEFEKETQALRDSLAPERIEIATLRIAPRKSDIAVSEVRLLWAPWQLDAAGHARPAYRISRRRT